MTTIVNVKQAVLPDRFCCVLGKREPGLGEPLYTLWAELGDVLKAFLWAGVASPCLAAPDATVSVHRMRLQADRIVTKEDSNMVNRMVFSNLMSGQLTRTANQIMFSKIAQTAIPIIIFKEFPFQVLL